MKDGMAEEDGDESEVLFLRVVLLEVPDVSGAKVVVDVGGVVELIASWDEDADASTLIPLLSPIPTTLTLSFDDASSTLTVLNSSRTVTSTAAVASVVRSVVLLSVGSSIPSSFGGEEAAAAAAAMVFFVCCRRKNGEHRRKSQIRKAMFCVGDIWHK